MGRANGQKGLVLHAVQSIQNQRPGKNILNPDSLLIRGLISPRETKKKTVKWLLLQCRLAKYSLVILRYV